MLWQDIQRIRDEAPLVHNITNYVVMNLTANALLSLGASPVMAHALDEVEELASVAGALVVNLGTLSPQWVEAMFLAARTAKENGVPIVFDPVGSGATTYRTITARSFVEQIQPTIVRGNASEIRSLVHQGAGTRGVDSSIDPIDVVDEARWISKNFQCVVSVSGKTDVVVGEGEFRKVNRGHPMMSKVTGMGCVSSALTAAFAACCESPFEAALHTMELMGIAGEMAVQRSEGPGSFVPAFLDVLYSLDESKLTSPTLD